MSARDAQSSKGERRVATGLPPVFIDHGPLSELVRSNSPVELDPAQERQLAHYRDLLIGWNERINLTAITDPHEVDVQLILDALRMAPAIADAASRSRKRPTTIDIGAGGGLPGIPLAIVLPGIDFTLLDATAKKVMVLGDMATALGLENVHALHGRAEEIGHRAEYRGRFSFATARAVASLPALVELTLPLLKPGGRAFFPKSANIDEELEQGEAAATIVGGRIESSAVLSSVAEGRVTRLVILVKMGETPKQFPRRSGLPAKEPLGTGRTL